MGKQPGLVAYMTCLVMTCFIPFNSHHLNLVVWHPFTSTKGQPRASWLPTQGPTVPLPHLTCGKDQPGDCEDKDFTQHPLHE